MIQKRSHTLKTNPPLKPLSRLLTANSLLPMLGILLIATLLRCQHISTVGVSFDESFTIKMIDFPWSEMLRRITLETQPPLFYVLLKVWAILFGNTVLAGRIFTSLWGVGGVWAMFLFVQEAYWNLASSQKENFRQATLPGLLAALMLACMPLQLFWTMQIRMYSMPLTLSLLSAYFLLLAVRSRLSTPRYKHWILFTLTASLLSYTHYFGLFVLLAEYAFAIGLQISALKSRQRMTKITGKSTSPGAAYQPQLDKQSPPSPIPHSPILHSPLLSLFSAGIVSLMWQPWLPYFLAQRQHVAADFYHPELSWAVWGRAFDQLWLGEGQTLSAWRGLFFTQVSVAVLLLLLIEKKRGDVLIGLLSVVPIACVLLISVVSHPMVVARYLMFSQLFLIAALAVVVSRVQLPAFSFWRSKSDRESRSKMLTTACVVAMCGWLAWMHYEYRNVMASRPGIKAAMESFDAQSRDELLVISNPMLFTSAIVYSADATRIRNYYPERGFPFYQGTPVMRDEEYITLEELDDSPRQIVWTLDAKSRSMGSVPVSRDWQLVEETEFREWFTLLLLRKYSRVQR